MTLGHSGSYLNAYISVYLPNGSGRRTNMFISFNANRNHLPPSYARLKNHTFLLEIKSNHALKSAKMYLFSPQGYCRGHLVKRLSCPEETGREGWDIDSSTLKSLILATVLTVLNSKWVMVSAVTQHVSAVTIGNVIALTVTALTFTHLFDSWKKGFLRSKPNHMSASTCPQR